VLKNERIEIQIDGMTSEGQGVGREAGFVVFVDGALVGEKVKVQIIKVAKSYAIGKLLEIVEASTMRQTPFCEVFGRCGGCALQHMKYEASLEFKAGVVRDALARIAGISDSDVSRVVLPIIGMKSPLNYRNKAQYPVSIHPNGSMVSGFYAKRSHDVVSHKNCAIQHETSNQVREIVMSFIKKYSSEITIFNETSGKGLIRHILSRVGINTGEVMVVIVATSSKIPRQAELVELLKGSISGLKGVFVNVNSERTNIILGKKSIKIYGADQIFETIGDLKFGISPLSFFQVNSIQTELLYSKAIEFAELSGRVLVYDLYCGTGTIGLFAARNARKVIGVEIVPEAIVDARANAAANGIINAEFGVGAAENIEFEADPSEVVVFLDPPRKGCEQSLLEKLVFERPQRIVYVSCDPATLARDVKILLLGGFKLESVQPFDMFPWCNDVEVVTLLSRE